MANNKKQTWVDQNVIYSFLSENIFITHVSNLIFIFVTYYLWTFYSI